MYTEGTVSLSVYVLYSILKVYFQCFLKEPSSHSAVSCLTEAKPVSDLNLHFSALLKKFPEKMSLEPLSPGPGHAS